MHAGDQLAQVGRVPLRVAEAREVEQLLGDFLAAEGFALNHLQVVADDLHVVGPVAVGAVEQLLRAGLRAIRCTGRSRPADC